MRRIRIMGDFSEPFKQMDHMNRTERARQAVKDLEARVKNRHDTISRHYKSYERADAQDILEKASQRFEERIRALSDERREIMEDQARTYWNDTFCGKDTDRVQPKSDDFWSTDLDALKQQQQEGRIIRDIKTALQLHPCPPPIRTYPPREELNMFDRICQAVGLRKEAVAEKKSATIRTRLIEHDIPDNLTKIVRDTIYNILRHPEDWYADEHYLFKLGSDHVESQVSRPKTSNYYGRPTYAWWVANQAKHIKLSAMKHSATSITLDLTDTDKEWMWETFLAWQQWERDFIHNNGIAQFRDAEADIYHDMGLDEMGLDSDTIEALDNVGKSPTENAEEVNTNDTGKKKSWFAKLTSSDVDIDLDIDIDIDLD